MADRRSVDEILKKYSGKISQQVNSYDTVNDVSMEYINFKEEMMPQISRYENFARSFSFINLNLSSKDEEKIQKYLDVAHLDLVPSQVATASFFGAFFTFVMVC